jgi:hypothetical protein
LGPARHAGDLAGGAVVNSGISYALPANYPTQGQSDRVELLGSDGTIIIDDDHMEHLIFFRERHGWIRTQTRSSRVARNGWSMFACASRAYFHFEINPAE